MLKENSETSIKATQTPVSVALRIISPGHLLTEFWTPRESDFGAQIEAAHYRSCPERELSQNRNIAFMSQDEHVPVFLHLILKRAISQCDSRSSSLDGAGNLADSAE
jgi:hypothetical protein